MTVTDQTPPPDYQVAEGALQFAAPALSPGEEPAGTRTPFQIIGDSTVLYAVKPKQGVLLALGRSVASLEETEDPAVQMAAYDQFMDVVLAPETRVYLESKFADPDHEWDLPILEPVMKGLIGAWFAGPTGARPGSAPSPRATGKRSTGRARSRARTQTS